MSTTYIRDGSARIVGYIKADSHGKQLAYAGGRMVGIYNPQLNRTFDASLRLYGYGNQLMALVRDADDD